MTQNIIAFPAKEPATKTAKPPISMNFTTVRNGKTVILNIAKLSNEEFMHALLGDSIMQLRQEAANRIISQQN